MSARYPFTDPTSGRELNLVLTRSGGVEHHDCTILAPITLQLDAWFCPRCGQSGRIDGAWVAELSGGVG